MKPTITATDPSSPGNTASPRVLGNSSVGTVSIYTDAACATTAIGSGTEAAFLSPGITATVPPDSTTTLYARAVTLDGTTPCSNGFTYTNSIPVPPPPPSDSGGGGSTAGSGPTGQRAAALAKCKKKRGKARAKCKRKANALPV